MYDKRDSGMLSGTILLLVKFFLRIFSEITIKSPSVRKHFIRSLRRNIQSDMSSISKEITVSGGWDHLFVTFDEKLQSAEKVVEKLKKTAGLESFSQVIEFPLGDFDSILQNVLSVRAEELQGKTFCVRVKRAGIHSFRSIDLERSIGGGILKNIPGTTVDLHNPEVLISLGVKNNTLSVFGKKIPAIGGYPIGTQGKVLVLLSGGYDSPVAAQMMMKNGCKVDFLFFNLGGIAHEKGVEEIAYHLWNSYSHSFPLKIFSVPFQDIIRKLLTKTDHRFRGILLKRFMLRIAEKVARRKRYKAIVTGESLAQVSSQTMQNLDIISRVTNMLLFRPVLTMNKQDIINYAKEIGTADFAENMPEYCGVVSDKPSADAKIQDILAEEEKFDMTLLEDAYREMKKSTVSDFEKDTDTPVIESISSVGKNEVIIDLREEEEVQECPLHVPEVKILTIPFYDLAKEFPNLDKGKEYLLYCERGVISRVQAEELLKKGYVHTKIYRPLETEKND